VAIWPQAAGWYQAMSSGQKFPSGEDGDEHEQLIKNAWSAVFKSDKFEPPPLQGARMREKLRCHFVEASVAELPEGDVLAAVDALLQWELRRKSLVDSTAFDRCTADNRVALWRGDITTLQIGAIVNAANERGLGCFQPSHRCIDNVIHCAAGPALRAACFEQLSTGFGGTLPTGHAMVTPGFNLPADYVIHTPGPVGEHPAKLAQCYKSVLECCKTCGIRSVAFCCISTGLFGYPAGPAAEVAVGTVRAWLDQGGAADVDLVVFNTFLESDLRIYQKLLC